MSQLHACVAVREFIHRLDPNLFKLDWERLAEVLTVIIVLAFFVERALAVLLESRFWLAREKLSRYNEWIALMTCLAVCWYLHFDALSIIVPAREQTGLPGIAITAAIIAGGSKASLKLFRDVLGIYSTAYAHKEQIRAERRVAHAMQDTREAQQDADSTFRSASPAPSQREADSLVELMTRAEAAVKDARDAWIGLKVEANAANSDNRWPALAGRWRLAEAQRAKETLDELDEAYELLRISAAGALGAAPPSVEDLEIALAQAKMRESAPDHPSALQVSRQPTSDASNERPPQSEGG